MPVTSSDCDTKSMVEGSVSCDSSSEDSIDEIENTPFARREPLLGSYK